MSHFEKIGTDTYLVRGRVHGYLLVRGAEALCVDPGPGAWVEHLDEIGVRRVTAVLGTHHHRDTLHHAGTLIGRGALFAAPAAEQRLIAGAAEFWRTARTYNLYDCGSDFSCLRASVPLEFALTGGQQLELAGWRVQALELNGHTPGSMAYVIEHAGQRLAFMGDNLAAPGTVHDLHDFHVGYMDFAGGAARLLERLPKLRALKPDLLLPAHNAPIPGVQAALDLLEKNIARHAAALKPNRISRPKDEIRQAGPSVWFVGLTTYCIVAKNGKGLFWDWGYLNWDRLAQFGERAGVKEVDVLTFSHYHDDHICRAGELAHRANHLADREKNVEHPRGARIWCHHFLHDILTRPHAWRMPCLWPQPIPIDRVYGDETIEWEGLKLEFFEFPGQTYYHVGMIAHVDGHRYAFTGDNIWTPLPGFSPHGPIIPRNRYFVDRGHVYCAEALLKREVDFICPGHGDAFPVTRADLEGYKAWAEETGASIRALCPDEPLGYDPWWLRFDPFHIYLPPGGEARFELVIESPFKKKVGLRLRPMVSSGIEVFPKEKSLEIPARGTARLEFQLKTPREMQPGDRAVVTMDLEVNGEAWGEMGEGLVEIR